MTLEDHPEQALDRAVAGKLTEAERASLDAHLAICLACRVHLALATVGGEAFSPHPWDGHSDKLAIDRTLAAFQRPRRRPFTPARRRVLWLSAAALLALGGIASAAWQHASSARRAVEADAPVGSSLRAAAKLASAVRPAEAPVVVSEAPSPSIASAAQPEGTPNALRPAVAPVSASGLFQKASALCANKPDAAIAVFLKLQKLFPQSRESRLSFVLAGRLLLERGHPGQAVAEFDQHLAGRGAASEDALAGRAAALEQQGNQPAEANTWQRLLAAYPKSVYASRAKARLSQIRRAQATSE